MADEAATDDTFGDRIRTAIDSADLLAIAAFLDVNVTWGAPDDTVPGCRGRREVLAWYRRGYDAGVRARVTDVSVNGDRVLVGLRVVGNPPGEAGGWQVLSLADGLVVDIRAFDEREPAAARAGING